MKTKNIIDSIKAKKVHMIVNMNTDPQNLYIGHKEVDLIRNILMSKGNLSEKVDGREMLEGLKIFRVNANSHLGLS